MSMLDTPDAPGEPTPTSGDRLRSLTVPAAASLGAGAVHAAAIGVHSEHRSAVIAFTVVAAFQLAWGALALVRPSRAVAVVGAAGNAAAIVGWLVAKASGLPIAGMREAEAVQLADALAAGLAAIAVVSAIVLLLDVTPRRSTSPIGAFAAAAVAALALPGMVSAGSHSHEGGDDHGHTAVAAAAATDHGDHGDEHAEDMEEAHGDHAASSVPAKPYDATLPVDLSGVEGVTPKQEKAAEALLTDTIETLPKFADPATAEAAGFHSIGDAPTGFEHYVNWQWINDEHTLDPNYPESLVYRIDGGEKILEAAMFMLTEDDTLDTVPELGGPLTQWHIHDNLCYTPDPVAPKVRGLTLPDGTCSPPLVKGKEIPMIHAWIVPHQCGPFAALEGVGGGQVKEGEEVLCDHAHGA